MTVTSYIAIGAETLPEGTSDPEQPFEGQCKPEKKTRDTCDILGLPVLRKVASYLFIEYATGKCQALSQSSTRRCQKFSQNTFAKLCNILQGFDSSNPKQGRDQSHPYRFHFLLSSLQAKSQMESPTPL
jgi:hypothetical protein